MACVGVVGAFALASLAGGDDRERDPSRLGSGPAPISKEVLVGSSHDSGTNTGTKVYEYDVEGGTCTRLETAAGGSMACGGESGDGVIEMRVTAFGDELFIYPRLSSEVARVELRSGAGVAQRADAEDVPGRRGRIAHLVVRAPKLMGSSGGVDEPPRPTVSSDAQELTVVAYDSAGRELARVPVFASLP